VHYPAQLTADASVRMLNSNLEENIEGETTSIARTKLFARARVEGSQHGASFDDAELSILKE
jgi:hypothetical protein